MSGAPPELPSACRLVAYDRLGSTNDEAKRLARAGAASWTIVSAGEQTAGRGRRGRSWIAIPGNLFMTVILRPDCTPQTAAQLGFVAALAVGEAVRSVIPAEASVRFKWPNDVLLDGAKVSGILLESETTEWGALDWLIVGIGVNVVGHPTVGAYRTTSLLAAAAREVDAPAMLRRIAAALHSGVEAWHRYGFGTVRAAWLRHAVGVGDPIAVHLDEAPVTGRFADLAEDGALIIETEQGVRRIIAGDLVLA
jgi:BirA family biotin operon repressor/biotin-[acetyl-CoA-carboxylase] ligase